MQNLTSLDHPLLKHLVKLRDRRSYRYDQRKVVIEGIKMVEEISRDFSVTNILVIDPSLIPASLKKSNKIFHITEKMMKRISTVEAPEGILAEVEMPSLDPNRLLTKKRLLALDGVSDPGNLGTLLRTALAFGWEGAFLFNECCDPFNDKALRAAKGATFRLPLAMGSWEELKSIAGKNELIPLIADVKGEEPEEYIGKKGLLLILGNEAHGPSLKVLRECRPISLPMTASMESLNVSQAGSILLYLLQTRN